MNPVELVKMVDAFYDQAFNRLLLITFGLVAFLGVLIPIAVGWLQLKSLRSEKSSLIKELRSDINSERESIEANIKKQVDDKILEIASSYEARFKELVSKTDKIAASAEARSFHLQGNTHKDSLPAVAVRSYCHATPLYIEASDESNAQRCLRVLIEDCLPNINSEQYNKHKIGQKCDKLIDKLKAKNENRRYTNDIERLERGMEMASKRLPEPDEG